MGALQTKGGFIVAAKIATRIDQHCVATSSSLFKIQFKQVVLFFCMREIVCLLSLYDKFRR